MRRLEGHVDAAQDALLEPLSAAERQQLVDLLQRLLEHHTTFKRPHGSQQPADTGKETTSDDA